MGAPEAELLHMTFREFMQLYQSLTRSDVDGIWQDMTLCGVTFLTPMCPGQTVIAEVWDTRNKEHFRRMFNVEITDITYEDMQTVEEDHVTSSGENNDANGG